MTATIRARPFVGSAAGNLAPGQVIRVEWNPSGTSLTRLCLVLAQPHSPENEDTEVGITVLSDDGQVVVIQSGQVLCRVGQVNKFWMEKIARADAGTRVLTVAS